MNRDFLDDVKFKRDIKLSRPSTEIDDQSEETPRRRNMLQAKVLRLIFFLVVCFALLWTVKFGFESLIGFCTGREHWTVEQMYHDYRQLQTDKQGR